MSLLGPTSSDLKPDACGEGWHYVEPCCGSASIALALLGARRPLLPYQGSKWRFRRALLERFEQAGFSGRPVRLQLEDIGPWGDVAATVLKRRAEVVVHLQAFGEEDARTVYERLHRGPVPSDPARYAAEFLFLQRLAYSGKAVGDPAARWSSPGFNRSSAYGLPGTERFGAVKPMIPSLLRVLDAYASLPPVQVVGGRRSALPPGGPVDVPTLVYLDPPYVRSTRYPMGDLDRPGVVDLATAWRHAGAHVVVSEGEAVGELVERGWTAGLLDPGRQDTSRFRGKQAEWVTWSGPSA